MIGQISAIKSSFPSAFSALGVGAVVLFGYTPWLSTFEKWPLLNLGNHRTELPSFIDTALPYVIGFVAFFSTYAVGFALIGVGSRLRARNKGNEAKRIASALAIRNEAFLKYYFEQRAVVDVFDGLGFSIGFSCVSFAIFVVYGEMSIFNRYLVCLAMLSGAAIFPYVFWKESNNRLLHLDAVTDLVGKLGKFER